MKIPYKRQADRSLDEKAEASLRKHKTTWYAHFSFNGQFFCRSLGTSDRSKAKREAKKLISLVATGKERKASSPAALSALHSASGRRSATDPKVRRNIRRGNTRRWKNASKEDREAHGDAIRDGLTPADLLARSKATAGFWKNHDYAESHRTASKKYWSKKSHRKAQSKKLLAAKDKPEVRKNRRLGRLKAARNLLRRRGVLKQPADPGRPGLPGEKREFFKHGLAMLMSIEPAMRLDEKAAVAARDAYYIEKNGHIPRETLARYDRLFRSYVLTNPPFTLPDGNSSR